MVADPVATVVASPVDETVAIPVDAEDHVAKAVTIEVEPSELIAVADSCLVSPNTTSGLPGITTIELTVTELLVIVRLRVLLVTPL